VRLVKTPSKMDGVRYARVGDLREHGFEVTHSPSQGNTLHVSVRYPGAWDDKVAGIFTGCFSAPVWHEAEGRAR
jgi:hypothetical protein